MIGKLVAALVLLAPAARVLGAAPTFGITATRTKAADATSPEALYGPGMKNLVRSGNELYVAFMNFDDTKTLGSVRVARSRDLGNTWDGTFLVASAVTATNGSGASIAIGPGPGGTRRAHVAWGAGYRVWYAQATLPAVGSRDVPGFTAPALVSGAKNAEDYVRMVFADASGGVHVVLSANSPTGVYYARSSDYGDSFLNAPAEPVFVGETAGGAFGSVMDSSGNISVVYRRPSTSGGGMGFVRRVASSGAWTAPVFVGDLVGEPSIDVYGTSRLHVAAIGSGIVAVRSDNAGATWTAPVKVAAAGSDISIAVAPSGAVNVGWRTSTVQLSRSTNAGATWSTPATVYAGDQPAYMVNLATDASGKALVAFQLENDTDTQSIAFTREK